jgi:hypothetical protein
MKITRNLNDFNNWGADWGFLIKKAITILFRKRPKAIA